MAMKPYCIFHRCVRILIKRTQAADHSGQDIAAAGSGQCAVAAVVVRDLPFLIYDECFMSFQDKDHMMFQHKIYGDLFFIGKDIFTASVDKL